jgi:hypothetical protein
VMTCRVGTHKKFELHDRYGSQSEVYLALMLELPFRR